MATHLAFLRAVNVGKRQYPMAELRAALQAAGYDDVETYIQTGNVRVTCPTTSRAEVEAGLEAVLEADRGFAVPVVVLSPAELTEVARDADELAATHPEGTSHYVSLLKHRPAPEAVARIEDHGHPGETAVVRGRAVHLLHATPYHEAKVSGALVERVLGLATNRNVKVLRALATRWGG